MRAFSAPLTPRPVGTVVCATTLRIPGSVATTSRAPERGRLVSRRDQNVIAFWLGSPDATPSWNAPGPMRRVGRQQLLRPGGRHGGDGAGGADRGDELAAGQAHLGHRQAEREGRRDRVANRANSERVDLQPVAAALELADPHARPTAACRARCPQSRARTSRPSGRSG